MREGVFYLSHPSDTRGGVFYLSPTSDTLPTLAHPPLGEGLSAIVVMTDLFGIPEEMGSVAYRIGFRVFIDHANTSGRPVLRGVETYVETKHGGCKRLC